MRILILTIVDSDSVLSEALHAGAAGYMLKGASAAELVDTVHRVHGGEQYVFPALAARLLAARQMAKSKLDDLFSTLTHREAQILEQLTSGLTNKEIGRRLDLSEKTVKHYVTSLLEKLHCRTRLEAALVARDQSKRRALANT
jgi:two-component system, NarL family, nitrate/nitrite response regulator NarL